MLAKLSRTFRHLMAYVDACAGLDAALKLPFADGIMIFSQQKAAALDKMGFCQRARMALEPALRIDPCDLAVAAVRQLLANEKARAPIIIEPNKRV